MPKVDLNPLNASGQFDPTDASGYKRAILLVVSFAIFFTAMAFGQDLAGKMQGVIANVTGMETSQNGPSIQVA